MDCWQLFTQNKGYIMSLNQTESAGSWYVWHLYFLSRSWKLEAGVLFSFQQGSPSVPQMKENVVSFVAIVCGIDETEILYFLFYKARDTISFYKTIVYLIPTYLFIYFGQSKETFSPLLLKMDSFLIQSIFITISSPPTPPNSSQTPIWIHSLSILF